jgi:hypothetical protein
MASVRWVRVVWALAFGGSLLPLATMAAQPGLVLRPSVKLLSQAPTGQPREFAVDARRSGDARGSRCSS